MEKQQERKTQRSMVADYYKVLQVPRNAKDDDLKKAAEAKLKQISQAYDVLSDPRKRAAHDQGLSDSRKRAAYNQNGEEGLKRGAPPPYKPWWGHPKTPDDLYSKYFGSNPAGLPPRGGRFNCVSRTTEDIFSEVFGGGGKRGMFGESIRGATGLEGSGDKDAHIPYADICYDSPDEEDDDNDEDGELHYCTNFPKDREKDVQEAWPIVSSLLESHGISCELNLVAGLISMSVSIPKVNQSIFAKAKIVLGFLAYSAAFEERKAMRILSAHDYEIIKFGYQDGGLCRKFEIGWEGYLKRKQLLLGYNARNISALRQFSGCRIFVQVLGHDDFLFAVGPPEGLRLIRTVVEDCIIFNVCPEVLIRKIGAVGKRDVYDNVSNVSLTKFK